MEKRENKIPWKLVVRQLFPLFIITSMVLNHVLPWLLQIIYVILAAIVVIRQISQNTFMELHSYTVYTYPVTLEEVECLREDK